MGSILDSRPMNADIVQIDGWIRPWPGRLLTPGEVVAALRAAGISGAVGAANSAGDLPWVVAAQGHRPLRVPGTEQLLVDALGEVAETTAGALMLTDEGMLVTPPSMEENWRAVLDPEEHSEQAGVNPPDVLLGRLDPDLLPLLARDTGCPFVWERADDLLVVAFEEPTATLHEHGFTKAELPVAALSLIGGRRHVSLLLTRGVLPGTTLSHPEPWTLSHSPEDVSDPALRAACAEWAELHATPESTIAALLDSPYLPHADEALLREALASPDDDHWSARVLTALGLPSHAADVHEGRVTLSSSQRVEPQSLRAVLRTAVGAGPRAGEERWRAQGPISRLQLAFIRFPALSVVMILLEVALAVFVTTWLLSTEERGWFYWLGWVTVLALVVDVVADTVMLLRRRPSSESSGPDGPGR